MWSPIVLCFLVGFALASTNNPGWKDNTEYVYEIRGRALTSLHDASEQYAGILIKAQLKLQAKDDGSLIGRLSDVQYGQIHNELLMGWDSHIPDSQVSYKRLEISEQPFQIEMKNGVVRNLYVNKQVSNWEANIIKSIVSQFQLDTKAERLINSHLNILPQKEHNSAVYKTMEDTVTGISETIYDIHPLPEYILQSQPWLVPHPHLKGDGEIIEIVKNKNFTESEQRPSYHFGFFGLYSGWEEPADNRVGDFLSRTSVSRAVLTGSLNRFTIQNTFTINKIAVRPTFTDKQKGLVVSMLNATLREIKPTSAEPEKLADPVALGDLVYRFNNPYGSNKVRSEDEQQRGQSIRQRRSISSQQKDQYKNSLVSDESDETGSEERWEQDLPKLNEAPNSPLLPLTMGYQGNSLKLKQNVVESAQKLAEEIGQDLQRPNDIPKENTVGKFLILNTLVRIMNVDEIKQVAAKLYNNEEKGTKRASWVAFRDSVAEAGSGPALLNMQDWISTNKIQGEEAAEALLTAAHSARQPTDEYIRTFYALITKPEVIAMKHVNESGWLAFTDLLRHVYADKISSHNNYPVHSYGDFRTTSGKAFLKNEVIPYLTKQLTAAISKGDVQQIHLYIRALGNIAHPKILESFEPYLEGKVQSSQFQRLLMVMSLDELTRVEPHIAQSVLYRIYQNVGEVDEVRVAAVYQLMRTKMTAEMLQRMAEYTNIDSSEQVNAAVKSSILDASRLEGPEFQPLRYVAKSAVPLLTKKEYSRQDSLNTFRSHVVQEAELAYKETYQTYASEDSFMPKGFKYSLRKRTGGINSRQLLSVSGIVSSVDDLLNVLNQQTQEYSQQKEQKRQQNSQQQQQWSSENIAKLLKMDEAVLEQLEGNWFVKSGAFQKMLSFDNRSIENLPEILRDIEKSLESGKSFQYMKMFVGDEKAVSYPTELGIPFIYTYDEPTIVNVDGKIRGKSTPAISSGQSLHKPDNVQLETEIRILVSGKAIGQLAIITPFDNQRYSAGYEKNFQLNVPVKVTASLDVKNEQLKVETELLDQQAPETNLLHFSTWPYTTVDDVYTTKPTHHQIKSNCHQMTHVFGLKQTGVHLQVQMCTSPKKMDIYWLYRQLQRHDMKSALLAPWFDENIEHNEFNLAIDQTKSPTKKVILRINYMQKYETEGKSTEGTDISQFDKTPESPRERMTDFIQRANSKISNVQGYALDAQVDFQGHSNKFRATAAVSKSNVDPKSRILFYAHRLGEQAYHWAAFIKNSFPNTNGLSFDYALRFDPTSNTQVQLAWGPNYDNAAKVNAEIKYTKSPERVEYLEKSPLARECRKQMQQGDQQMPECAMVTAWANSLDRIDAKVQYDKINPRGMNCSYQLYSMLRHIMFPRVEENVIDPQGPSAENQMDINVRFLPDFQAVNISLSTKNLQSEIRNIQLNSLARKILAVHPVFHLKSRVMSEIYNYNTYRPQCVVDKTRASTFVNKTYHLSTLGDDWTVMMQYVPRRANQDQIEKVSEQLEKEIESYVVLVRGRESREVKIVYSNPDTEQKLVEITIKEGQPAPSVFVNQQQVQYSAQKGMDYFNGQLQIYALPNNEVKIEIMDNFYVISDGKRVKLTITDGKYRNSVRGICGSFDEPATDYQSPKNCILRDSQQLIASYTIMEANRSNKQVEELQAAVEKNQCYQKETNYYANVVSSNDSKHRRYTHQQCTVHRTQYFAENGNICFSIRPMPVCRPECNHRVTIPKNIQVFCLKKSHMADMYQQQIDKGASPDFSLKEPTKSIRVDLPVRCMP